MVIGELEMIESQALTSVENRYQAQRQGWGGVEDACEAEKVEIPGAR
jgi:hypothetical protein